MAKRVGLQVKTRISLHASNDKDMKHAGSFCKGLSLVLRQVDECGALYSGAKKIKLAYSKAWMMINATEQMFQKTLLKRDGTHGSVLTHDGTRLLGVYEQLDQECAEFANRRLEELLEECELSSMRRTPSLRDIDKGIGRDAGKNVGKDEKKGTGKGAES
jgi:molybdate transport system regulatory protein